MKKYVEVNAQRLAELVLVTNMDECIDFAEEWDRESETDLDDKFDASGWHGIKMVNLFDEICGGIGLIAIGMWGGGWTRVYDTTGDGTYETTLYFATDFIQQYFVDIECETVLAELEVYKDGTTLLDKIKTK